MTDSLSPAQSDSLAARTTRGLVAGCVATAPMTAALFAIEALLPPEERLPSLGEPTLLTKRIFRRAEVDDELTDEQEEGLAWVGHFAYGAACGALYGAAVKSPDARHSLMAGAALGAAVWTLSYAGWLPAVGLIRPPHRRPAARSVEFIAAHLVWGAATVMALRMMEPSADRELRESAKRAPNEMAQG